MAQYRYEEQPISRGKGRSAVMYAAYCHATKMRSEVEGSSASYYEKADQLMHSEIAAPERLPDWAADTFGVSAFQTTLEAMQETEDGTAAIREAWARSSELLWNSVERAERELNHCFSRARYAFSTVITIPVELPLNRQIELTRGFVHSAFVQHGVCADWVIHDKGDGHPHIHVISTTRCLATDGWGRKMPEWYNWDALIERRELWKQHANVRLGALGVHDRVDHRNYGARGLNLEPDTANPHYAENADRTGQDDPDRQRAIRARQRNQAYLKKHPEHFVDIMQAAKQSFTATDIRRQVKKRMEVSVTKAGLEELCVTDDELRKLGDQALKAKHLVQVEPNAPDGSLRYMTSAQLTGSADLTRKAQVLAEGRLEAVTSYFATDVMEEDEPQSAQRMATETMLTPTCITLVQCWPGSGMVAALEEATRLWQSRGFEVCGAALTSEYKRNLAAIEGLRFRPLARWDFLWSRGTDVPTERTVFVLADAGMVDVPQWSRIVDRIQESSAKIIALRDPDRPLPCVGSSGWYAVEAGVGHSIGAGRTVSQQGVGDCMATIALERGGSGARIAIEHYGRNGAIRLCHQSEDPFAVLARAYWETKGHRVHKVALGFSDSDVHALNRAIREEALRRGKIDAGSVRSYEALTRIDRSGTVPRSLGAPREFGMGDRITLTRFDNERSIPELTFGLVLGPGEDVIQVLMDEEPETRLIDRSAFQDIDYGFAVTLHQAERLTADHAFVLAHGSMHRHAVHVAFTRHRQSVTMVGRPGHVESLADLIHLAQIPGHLTVGGSDVPDSPRTIPIRSAERRPAEERSPIARSAHDLSPLVETFAREGFGSGINALADPAIVDVAAREVEMSFSSWSDTEFITRGGAERYVKDPTLVVDDLLRNYPDFEARDIAFHIAREAKGPEKFLRTFMGAMAHPDIVPISKIGHGGRSQTYLTREALQLGERVVRIVDSQAEQMTDEPRLELPESVVKLPDGEVVPEEYMCALPPEKLKLIRCADDDSRTEIARELAWDYERSGGTVVGMALTSDGLVVPGQAGLRNLMTVWDYCEQVKQDRMGHGRNSLVILNEASHIGNYHAQVLLERQLTSGGTLVAILDDSPVAPVEENPVFRTLELRFGATRIVPKRGRYWKRPRLSRRLSLGGLDSGYAMLELEEEVVKAGGTIRGAVERIAEDFVNDYWEDRVVLTFSQVEADAVNTAIRAKLDAKDPRRWPYVEESGGRLAGLRSGDRISFMESVGEFEISSPDTAEPDAGSYRTLVCAGETAEVLSRDEHGGLRLRVEWGAWFRDVTITPDIALPSWRFAFAGTIENELPRSRNSIHVLVSHAMPRQALLCALDMHVDDLNVVVPAAKHRDMDYLSKTLEDTTGPRICPEYGLQRLIATEAVNDEASDDSRRRVEGVRDALVRIREAANLGPRDLPKAFPRGVVGDTLADVFGAAVLKEGDTPSGPDRLAMEMLLTTLADLSEWLAIQKQLPTSVPKQAEALARACHYPSGDSGGSAHSLIALYISVASSRYFMPFHIFSVPGRGWRFEGMKPT